MDGTQGGTNKTKEEDKEMIKKTRQGNQRRPSKTTQEEEQAPTTEEEQEDPETVLDPEAVPKGDPDRRTPVETETGSSPKPS